MDGADGRGPEVLGSSVPVFLRSGVPVSVVVAVSHPGHLSQSEERHEAPETNWTVWQNLLAKTF